MNKESSINMSRRIKVTYYVLAFLPLIYTILSLPVFPDLIPAHYNIDGEIDRWGSKYENLIFPIIILIFSFAMRKYTQRTNSTNIEQYIILFVLLVLNITCFFFLISAYVEEKNQMQKMYINMQQLFGVLSSILFFLIGIIIPNIGYNSAIGIRNRWTISDEKVWNNTHKKSRWIFLTGGLLGAIGSFYDHGGYAITIFMVLILFIILSCTLLSIRCSKNDITRK